MTNSLGMDLVLLPPGEFRMGAAPEEPGATPAEFPQHLVRLTTPFRLGKHEVTVAEFRAFVEATGYRTEVEREGHAVAYWGAEGKKLHPGGNWQTTPYPLMDRQPVGGLVQADAAAFCDWISNKEGRQYRLPTEAEWEYAARAGSVTAYPTGMLLTQTQAASRQGNRSGPPRLAVSATPLGS